MRPYLKNPITQKDWDSVSRSESTCLAKMRTSVQNNSKKYKQYKTKQENQKERRKNTLIGEEDRHQEDQGGKPIQGNSLHNSISKVPTKTT
jgi:hypothetical protein